MGDFARPGDVYSRGHRSVFSANPENGCWVLMEGVPPDVLNEALMALFLMTSNVVFDKVSAALSGMQPELVQTNLSSDQEAALREAFGEETEPASVA